MPSLEVALVFVFSLVGAMWVQAETGFKADDHAGRDDVPGVLRDHIDGEEIYFFFCISLAAPATQGADVAGALSLPSSGFDLHAQELAA